MTSEKQLRTEVFPYTNKNGDSYLNHKYHKHPMLLKDLISDSHEEKSSDKIKHGKGRKKHRWGRGEREQGRREMTSNNEKRSIQKISP